MTHPCASHLESCDHCAICESGVCCAGLSAEQRAQFAAAIQAKERSRQFRQAVAAEAERCFSLAELIQVERERQVLGAPAYGVAAPPIRALVAADASPDTRKEAVYVHAARAVR